MLTNIQLFKEEQKINKKKSRTNILTIFKIKIKIKNQNIEIKNLRLRLKIKDQNIMIKTMIKSKNTLKKF